MTRIRYCCEDVSLIENYELAKADTTQKWVIHHRLETHTSDGELRRVSLSRKELVALGMYYNRPAKELIYMPAKDHLSLHSRINNPMDSTENRKKVAESKIGNAWNKGKKFTEDHKKKISEKLKGRKRSIDFRKKLSDAKIGKHWFNDGVKNIMAKECPDDFVPGRLKK